MEINYVFKRTLQVVAIVHTELSLELRHRARQPSSCTAPGSESEFTSPVGRGGGAIGIMVANDAS